MFSSDQYGRYRWRKTVDQLPQESRAESYDMPLFVCPGPLDKPIKLLTDCIIFHLVVWSFPLKENLQNLTLTEQTAGEFQRLDQIPCCLALEVLQYNKILLVNLTALKQAEPFKKIQFNSINNQDL